MGIPAGYMEVPSKGASGHCASGYGASGAIVQQVSKTSTRVCPGPDRYKCPRLGLAAVSGKLSNVLGYANGCFKIL
eukprot:70007-Prorocentrum_minimum.AAC.4